MDIKRFLWELSGFDLIFGPLRCPNCDSKLKRSDCFCPECGHKLPWNENKNKKKSGNSIVGGIIGVIIVIIIAAILINLIQSGIK